MVKFLKEKKVVILLTGRHAGKKAVIVKAVDDGSGARPYGHALVAGLDRAPRKVIRKASEAKQAKAAKLRTFIKVVNYQHLMPTRYSLEIDLKAAVPVDCVGNAAKLKAARGEAKAIFEEKLKTGQNKWFFSKLRF